MSGAGYSAIAGGGSGAYSGGAEGEGVEWDASGGLAASDEYEMAEDGDEAENGTKRSEGGAMRTTKS